MPTALYVARIMHNDMVITNATSWQWWTAISQVDFKDGLVYLDDGAKVDFKSKSVKFDGQYHDSKLLWIMGNYSRFVRPGMVRVNCTLSEEQSIEDGLLVSAYKDVQNGNLVYVLTNLSQENIKVDFGQDKKVKTYTTDATNNLGFSFQNSDKIKIPARSVVTVLN